MKTGNQPEHHRGSTISPPIHQTKEGEMNHNFEIDQENEQIKEDSRQENDDSI